VRNPPIGITPRDTMFFRILADATVVLHLAFVVFVVFGGCERAGQQ